MAKFRSFIFFLFPAGRSGQLGVKHLVIYLLPDGEILPLYHFPPCLHALATGVIWYSDLLFLCLLYCGGGGGGGGGGRRYLASAFFQEN